MNVQLTETYVYFKLYTAYTYRYRAIWSISQLLHQRARRRIDDTSIKILTKYICVNEHSTAILDSTKHIWSPDSAYPSYPNIPSAARTSILSHSTTGFRERTLSTLTSTRFPSSVTRSMIYSSSLSSTGSASRIRFSRTRTVRITRRSIGQTT